MKSTSIQPFLLPAAIVISALVLGWAIYSNSMQKAIPQGGTPIPTASATPIPTTPVITATVKVTLAPTTVAPTPTISDSVLLKAAVLAKSGIPANKFEFSIGKNLGTMASGSVRNTDDMGGAAWFAGKKNGTWKASYIGQGVPTCAEIADFPYPTTWLSHCLNASGDTIAR